MEDRPQGTLNVNEKYQDPAQNDFINTTGIPSFDEGNPDAPAPEGGESSFLKKIDAGHEVTIDKNIKIFRSTRGEFVFSDEVTRGTVIFSEASMKGLEKFFRS